MFCNFEAMEERNVKHRMRIQKAESLQECNAKGAKLEIKNIYIKITNTLQKQHSRQLTDWVLIVFLKCTANAKMNTYKRTCGQQQEIVQHTIYCSSNNTR